MVKNCFKIVLGVKKEFVIPQLLIRKALIELQLDDEVVTREITDLYFDIWSLNDDNSYQIDLYLVDNNELSIGYLLDEDFEIEDIDMTITNASSKEEYEFAIQFQVGEQVEKEVEIELNSNLKNAINYISNNLTTNLSANHIYDIMSQNHDLTDFVSKISNIDVL